MKLTSYILIDLWYIIRILQYDQEGASYKYMCFSDEEFDNDNKITILNLLTSLRN